MRKPIRKQLHKIAGTLLIIVVFTSCSKDDNKNALKSKTSLITQSPWSMTKLETKTNNGIWSDIYPGLNACTKDNKSTFSSSGTYTLDEGATKCDPGDPQNSTLSWSFGANETMLTIGTATYTLDQLGETTLVFSSSSENNGNTYYTRYTYGH